MTRKLNDKPSAQSNRDISESLISELTEISMYFLYPPLRLKMRLSLVNFIVTVANGNLSGHRDMDKPLTGD